jgi:hypothetical protein
MHNAYADHIKNKALLSYNNSISAENLAIYLAEEIIQKNKLLWLKNLMEKEFAKLTDEERDLLAVRYFGKRRAAVKEHWETAESERQYFRRQNRVSEKVAAMLQCAGLTKEVYERDFAKLDIFERVQKLVNKKEQRQRNENKRKEKQRALPLSDETSGRTSFWQGT